MSKVTPLPVEEMQKWQMIEEGLRPLLTNLSAEPGDIDRVMAQVKIIFDGCALNLDWSLNVKGHKERAAWVAIKGLLGEVWRFHQKAIFQLCYELAKRELALTSGKPGDPPRSNAEGAA